MKTNLMIIYDKVQERYVEIMTEAPHIMEHKLMDLLKGAVLTIKIIGGIDSRLVCFTATGDDTDYIIRLCLNICEAPLLLNQLDKIKLINKNFASFRDNQLHESFFNTRTKVVLLSLAKPEVYTYPRFALGISYIANSLRNQNKSDVYLYDLQLMDINQFLEKIIYLNPNILGISMTFGLFDVMRNVIDEIQRVFPKLQIIVGGSLATIDYEEIISLYPNVFVSLGEGEDCWPQLIDWLNGKISIKEIDNIAYYESKVKLTRRTTPQHKYSLPELDLLHNTFMRQGVFQIETSRGCYNACSFCPRQHKGNWKPIVDDSTLVFFITEYIRFLKHYQIKNAGRIIYIVDEEFVGKDCDANRERIRSLIKIFDKFKLKFEISIRMNNVYSVNGNNIERIKFINELNHSGLNRLLIGVESGVDSVLTRFNKNITQEENIKGIRILTALGVPIRFTYITFDPLMTFDELISTYYFLGRKDLIINRIKDLEINSLLNIVDAEEGYENYFSNEPFYHNVPYMLTSLECLIGSQYCYRLERAGFLEDITITALGKKMARYLDWRIGIISKFCQLWIDNCFTLDYTLKSLGKIYIAKKSEIIRASRNVLKDNSYKLLGKMIYLFTSDVNVIKEQSDVEIEFITNLCKTAKDNINKQSTNIIEDNIYCILNFQKKVLTESLKIVNSRLEEVFTEYDYNNYLSQYENWEHSNEWILIHNH